MCELNCLLVTLDPIFNSWTVQEQNSSSLFVGVSLYMPSHYSIQDPREKKGNPVFLFKSKFS